MKANNLFRFVVPVMILIPLVFSRCSDKGDDLPKEKNYKFTITVNGAASTDRAQFLIVGGSPTAEQTIWKVNGTTRNNEQGVGFNTIDFAGTTKTYVIESIKPITHVQVSVQCINFDAPFTYSYKAEVNSSIRHDLKDVVAVEGTPFSATYTY